MNILNEENKAVDQKNYEQGAYECHICLEVATEPILTTCGHLFCWPCIYQWFNSNQEFISCPVCKNGTSTKLIIPLYSKSDDDRQKLKQRDPNIPPRPKPQRISPVRNQNSFGNGTNTPTQNNLNNGVMLAGYGLFPSLYNLNLVLNPDFQEDPQDLNQIELKLLPKLRIWLFGTFLFFAILFLLLI